MYVLQACILFEVLSLNFLFIFNIYYFIEKKKMFGKIIINPMPMHAFHGKIIRYKLITKMAANISVKIGGRREYVISVSTVSTVEAH